MFKVTAWITMMPYTFGDCIISSTFSTFAAAKQQQKHWERTYGYTIIERI